MYSNSILIHSVIVRKINDASMNLQARHFFMRRQNHEKNSPNNEFLLGNLHCPSNDLLFWIWNFFFLLLLFFLSRIFFAWNRYKSLLLPDVWFFRHRFPLVYWIVSPLLDHRLLDMALNRQNVHINSFWLDHTVLLLL